MSTKVLMAALVAFGLAAGPAVAGNTLQFPSGPKSPARQTMQQPNVKAVQPTPAPTYNAHRYQGGPSSSVPHRAQ